MRKKELYRALPAPAGLLVLPHNLRYATIREARRKDDLLFLKHRDALRLTPAIPYAWCTISQLMRSGEHQASCYPAPTSLTRLVTLYVAGELTSFSLCCKRSLGTSRRDEPGYVIRKKKPSHSQSLHRINGVVAVGQSLEPNPSYQVGSDRLQRYTSYACTISPGGIVMSSFYALVCPMAKVCP